MKFNRPEKVGAKDYPLAFFYLPYTKILSMCNFMGVRVTKSQFIRLKQIERELGTLAALEVLKSGFAYSDSPVIVKAGDEFEIENMHWEFIPPWIKNMTELQAARKQGIPWLNARSETIMESRMFGDAARKRRCLVIASHFFEWRHYKPDGAKKDIAYPYLVTVNDAEYFFMAGIWQPWTDRETGETINTFAIVTTAANEFMSVIHNSKKRQPTILTEALAWQWINPQLTEGQIKQIASYQLSSENFMAHTIAKDFKTSPDPLAQFDYPELPPLDIAI